MKKEVFLKEFDHLMRVEAEKCGCIGCMAMCCAREGLYERETERLYQRYLAGDSVEVLVKETCDVLRRIKSGYEEEVAGFLSQAKERLFLHVEMGEAEEGYPSQQFYDMRIRYRIMLRAGESLLLNRQLAEHYHLQAMELYLSALHNSMKLFPAVWKTADHGMYVVKAEGLKHGAGVMFYPSFREEAEKRMRGGYYVLPSSVHEIILMPEKVRPLGMDLNALVQRINLACVDAGERLSRMAYHVEKETRKMMSVSEYDASDSGCPFIL